MTDTSKPQRAASQDASTHPETKKSAQRVPGDESSKASSQASPDARTGQDKDGNAEQQQATRTGAPRKSGR